MRVPLGAATGRTLRLQKRQHHPCPGLLAALTRGSGRPRARRAPPASPGRRSRVSAPSSPTSLLQGSCVSCLAVRVGCFTS